MNQMEIITVIRELFIMLREDNELQLLNKNDRILIQKKISQLVALLG
jgi:hypothetical protein